MRIALIHATRLAMEPIQAAFRREWPEPELMNVLDDSLSLDRGRGPDLTPAMIARFECLARYAVDCGAAGILFTCSAFGPAIEAAAHAVQVPVLKPNEAMFEAALARGARIGLVATFASSLAPMCEEFDAAARFAAVRPTLVTELAEGAMDALQKGDGAHHDTLIAEAATRLGSVDAVMLAQFSMARAAAAVRARVGVPVLTSPESAVAKLRARLTR
jgi:Asp/Glu/hydantoin racemase